MWAESLNPSLSKLAKGGNMRVLNIGRVIFYFSTIFLILWSMSGCAPTGSWNVKMYSGPKLPSDQLAFLKTTPTLIPIAVDGKKISWFDSINSMWIELLPGPHTVLVAFSASSSKGVMSSRKPVELTFNPKSGHHYKIEALRYFTNGNDIYSLHYAKIATDEKSENAKKCREKLSLKWKPKNEDLVWHPYIVFFNEDVIVPQLNEVRNQQTNELNNIIETQKELAIPCMESKGDKNYFSPLVYWDYRL
jgi:hypothetical protein